MLYALYGFITLYFPGRGGKFSRTRPSMQNASTLTQDQRIRALQQHADALHNELLILQARYEASQKEVEQAQSKAGVSDDEIKRREEWVKTSEDMLNKVKEENLALRKQYADKELELQEEFTKNVDLNKELRQLNERIAGFDSELKARSDEIEAKKHLIERYLKEIDGH